MNSKSKEILTKNVKKERINVIFYNIKKIALTNVQLQFYLI